MVTKFPVAQRNFTISRVDKLTLVLKEMYGINVNLLHEFRNLQAIIMLSLWLI